MPYILDEAAFTPPDLGETVIKTNEGDLILRNPCAYDYYQITREIKNLSKAGNNSMFVKAFTTGSILGKSLGKNQVVDPLVLGKLDPESLQRLIQFTIDMQMAIVPKIDQSVTDLIKMAGINLDELGDSE